MPEEQSPLLRSADRDAAVERVQQAYTDGALSHQEMDRRLEQVLGARSQHELEVALSALPVPDPGRSATIGAASGRIKRTGAWRVPRHLKVESAFGRVKLDLSQAVFEHPDLHLELNLGTGGALIKVPRDAVVEIDNLQTGWKDSQYHPPADSTGTGPRIHITGALGFGKLRIRHARR